MGEQLTNSQILSKVFKGTNAYQLGAPDPTQVGIAKTMRWLDDPANSEWRNNTFIPNLLNMIGTQLVRNKAWTNPLAAPFKRVNGTNNKAVEEIMVRLIKSRAYTPKAQGNLLEYNPPEVEVALHTVNRKDVYPITYQPYELESAFLSEYGLSNFFTAVMEAPRTSDNRDEYLMMLDLIAKYEHKWGFFKVATPDITAPGSGKAEVDRFLEIVQAYAAKLAFIKSIYNPYHMETSTKPEELVLITTPEAYAKMNVQSLAQAFHVEYAKLDQRIVIVDEMPIPDTYALLVDENWFVCGDTLLQAQSFFNGATLNTNYWLHHWGIYSVSPMLNAVAFSKVGTEVPSVTVTTGEYSVGIYNGLQEEIEEISRSNPTYLKGMLKWTANPAVDGFPSEFLPTDFQVLGVTKEVNGEDVPVEINSRTYVDKFGEIHFQAAITAGMKITIKATSTYNSDGVGTAEHYEATETFVIGE